MGEQGAPAWFALRVYRDHGEAIIAAVHDNMPPEHDGHVCDEVASAVGRLVAELLHSHPQPERRGAGQ